MISYKSECHGEKMFQEILGIPRTTLGDDGMSLDGVTVVLEREGEGGREGGR